MTRSSTSSTRTDPSRDISPFSAIWDDLVGSRPFERLSARLTSMALDTTETANTVTVHLPLPGFKREHITLEVTHEAAEGVELTICAVRNERKVEHCVVVGDHSRPINATAITSHLEDGLLTITCPKRAASKPRRVEVT